MDDGAAPAMAAVIDDQPLAQDLVGDLLEPRLDGRAHRKTATIKTFLAVALEKLAAHLLGEEFGPEEAGFARPADDEGRGLGRSSFGHCPGGGTGG